MVEYDIVKTHNQRFNVQANGNIVEFIMHEFRGVVFVSISMNGEYVATTIPAVGWKNLIPKSCEVVIGGNFMFATVGSSYPSYENFGTPMCKLVFTGEDLPNGTV